MDYEFLPLQKDTARGTFTCGHAMRWRPSDTLKLTLIVSEAALQRDFVDIPFSNMREYLKPGVRPQPHPGDSIREAVKKFKGGLAYFNAGEMGMLNCPLIVDGCLVTKPKPVKVLSQKKWEPLTGDFTFFLQYPDGRVEMRDLQLNHNRLLVGLPGGTYGFSAPYIFKNGRHVPLKNPPPGRPPGSQEVFFPAGGKTQSPISAMGLDKENRVVRLALVGDVAQPGNIERLPTEFDLIPYLQAFGVVDALYTGASGDVQYYDGPTQTLIVGPERPKRADGKWVLKEGQMQRGLTTIGVLRHF
ncbi:MAG: hypothetical protein JXM69_20790 [Anaerolineae bacterium]|nr:hypothetical protein [Anaerolineae bacterium]